MNPSQAHALRELLQGQSVAALGTLHGGGPWVSMAPFAMLPAGDLVIHVSHLAAHTQDMLRDARVSVLVMAGEDPDVPPQARPRVTLQGHATPCEASTSAFAEARSCYLAKFPGAAELLELPGFTFFVIRPASIRFVGGFAQAADLTPQAFAAAVTQA